MRCWLKAAMFVVEILAILLLQAFGSDGELW